MIAAAEDMRAVRERLAKRKATAIATAALAGWQVVETRDGSFICGKYGLTSRPLPDVESLEDYLERATGSELRQ